MDRPRPGWPRRCCFWIFINVFHIQHTVAYLHTERCEETGESKRESKYSNICLLLVAYHYTSASITFYSKSFITETLVTYKCTSNFPGLSRETYKWLFRWYNTVLCTEMVFCMSSLVSFHWLDEMLNKCIDPIKIILSTLKIYRGI